MGKLSFDSILFYLSMKFAGKDVSDIKIWRPITLSNCDAKIITKALTIRMSKVLGEIIDEYQTAHMK